MKRRSRVMPLLRLVGRTGTFLLALLLMALIGVQFVRVVDENVILLHRLAVAKASVRALQERRAAQLREIARLSSPQGAIPEIHARLRMVGPHERLIFVKPEPTPSAPP
ncbi:MAG: hypothetical protein ACYDGW_05645 [Vulcanimicrobiaceae bacterium]